MNTSSSVHSRVASALVLAGAALLLAPPNARATERFPRDVAAALPGIGVPACSLCHAGGTTGRGTATTPFGLALRARGLTAGDPSSVARAIEKLAADRTDSDGDGTGDVDELTMGADPNVPAGGNAAPPIEYGCAQVAPGNAAASPAAAFLVVLACIAIVARSRRRAPRRERRLHRGSVELVR